MMDFWYERAIRELTDVNEEATELLRKAREASLPPPPPDAEDEEE
jgi:hypothetical protein